MTVEDLVVRIQTGNTELMAELWEKVRKLIAWHARRYYERFDCSRKGVELDDLVQAGYLALVESVRKYDETQEAKFTTFFAYDLFSQFQATTGRTHRQRCDLLNHAVSLDAPTDDGDPDGRSLYDAVADSESLSFAEDVVTRVYLSQLHDELEAELSELAEREAEIIRARYFEGNTLTEIAEARSTSFNEVRSLEQKAFRNLRKIARRRQLEKYLDSETPFYLQVGPDQFNRSHTSAVERLVLLREEKEREYARLYPEG